jgi:hypothetical protein
VMIGLVNVSFWLQRRFFKVPVAALAAGSGTSRSAGTPAG